MMPTNADIYQQQKSQATILPKSVKILPREQRLKNNLFHLYSDPITFPCNQLNSNIDHELHTKQN